MKTLKKFSQEETKRLRNIIECTDKEFVLFNTIKLNEEAGEICNEILKHFKCARKNKLEQAQELGSEIADVVIVASILAESMNIDLEKALNDKIQKIEKRYN